MSTLLPVELLHQIFDNFALKPELIRASLVCRSWRLAAFLHPTYSKQVIVLSRSIDSMTSNQLALASAQLLRAPSDAYNITLDIRAEGFSCSLASSANVAYFCRNVVRKRLAGMRTLRVRYSDTVLQELVHVLQTSGGAPALEELVLSPGLIHVSQYHVLEQRNGQIKAVTPQEAQRHRRSLSKGGWFGRLASKLSRQDIMAYGTACESPTSSAPSTVLRDGMLRRPGYIVTVTLPRSLDIVAPNLRTLKLQHVELPEQEGLQFGSVRVLWLESCRGFALARVVEAFPNLRTLWSANSGCQVEQSTDFIQLPETLKWFGQLDSLLTDDLKVVHELIERPRSSASRPVVRHLTMLDARHVANWIDQFVLLAKRRCTLFSPGLSDGSLHHKLEPFDLELEQPTDSQHSITRLSFHHPASNTSFGLRLELSGGSLIEYYSRAYVHSSRFYIQTLMDRFTMIVLPETLLQYYLQGMGHLPKLCTIEIALSEGGRFSKVRRGAWHAVNVPPPRTLRLRRSSKESNRLEVIQVLESNLLRAMKNTFIMPSDPQCVVELEDGVQLRHDPSISSIVFKDLAAICGE